MKANAIVEWIMTIVYAALSASLLVSLIILFQSYAQLRHINGQLGGDFDFDKLNAQIDKTYASMSVQHVQCSGEARQMRRIEKEIGRLESVEMQWENYVEMSDKVTSIKRKLAAMRHKLSET